jgi:DNA-binding PadR family transcriptional regulator
MLGELEYALITATVRFGDEAYGTSIRSEIERLINRRCSIGALHTTLDRLENKGLVHTGMAKLPQSAAADRNAWFA